MTAGLKTRGIFAQGLSYVACGNLKFPCAQQCSSGPQQMFAAHKGYAIGNHGKRCPEMAFFPKLILHRCLSHGDEASQGKSTDLWKLLRQGPISLIPACINEAVSGPFTASFSHPGFYCAGGESPQQPLVLTVPLQKNSPRAMGDMFVGPWSSVIPLPLIW